MDIYDTIGERVAPQRAIDQVCRSQHVVERLCNYILVSSSLVRNIGEIKKLHWTHPAQDPQKGRHATSWTSGWHSTNSPPCAASIKLFEREKSCMRGLSTKRSRPEKKNDEIDENNFHVGKHTSVRTYRVDVTNSAGKGFLAFKQVLLSTASQ